MTQAEVARAVKMHQPTICRQQTGPRQTGRPELAPRRLSRRPAPEVSVSTTGDLMPIMYLVEKYLADAEQKQKAALAELTRRIPDLLALLNSAGVK